jgi:hypothetical protein
VFRQAVVLLVMSQVPLLATQWPLELQTKPAGQVPQRTGSPQLSVLMPQTAEPQLLVVGTQHDPGPPFAPLQVLGATQAPQRTVPPQPSFAVPQLLLPQA